MSSGTSVLIFAPTRPAVVSVCARATLSAEMFKVFLKISKTHRAQKRTAGRRPYITRSLNVDKPP